MKIQTPDIVTDKSSITVPKSQASLYDRGEVLLYFDDMKNTEHENPIPGYIKKARLAMQMTQDQFAAEFNCTKSNVSGWEKGRHEPPYRILRAIAKISGVPLPVGNDHGDAQEMAVYRTSDPQKKLIIEAVLYIDEQDGLDYIEKTLNMAMELVLREKEKREEEHREYERVIAKIKNKINNGNKK